MRTEAVVWLGASACFSVAVLCLVFSGWNPDARARDVLEVEFIEPFVALVGLGNRGTEDAFLVDFRCEVSQIWKDTVSSKWIGSRDYELFRLKGETMLLPCVRYDSGEHDRVVQSKLHSSVAGVLCMGPRSRMSQLWPRFVLTRYGLRLFSEHHVGDDANHAPEHRSCSVGRHGFSEQGPSGRPLRLGGIELGRWHHLLPEAQYADSTIFSVRMESGTDAVLVVDGSASALPYDGPPGEALLGRALVYDGMRVQVDYRQPRQASGGDAVRIMGPAFDYDLSCTDHGNECVCQLHANNQSPATGLRIYTALLVVCYSVWNFSLKGPNTRADGRGGVRSHIDGRLKSAMKHIFLHLCVCVLVLSATAMPGRRHFLHLVQISSSSAPEWLYFALITQQCVLIVLQWKGLLFSGYDRLEHEEGSHCNALCISLGEAMHQGLTHTVFFCSLWLSLLNEHTSPGGRMSLFAVSLFWAMVAFSYVWICFHRVYCIWWVGVHRINGRAIGCLTTCVLVCVSSSVVLSWIGVRAFLVDASVAAESVWMVDVFMYSGVVLPLSLGLFFWSERWQFCQLVGALLR